MNSNQNPKTALITGANGRIGLELAKECLDMGYHAIIHYRSSIEPALSALGGDERVTFIQADLTESPEKFIHNIVQLPISLVGLINNASVFQEGNLSDIKHFYNILHINTLVPLRLSTEFAKVVKNGWIINLTDARTSSVGRRYQNYRITKLFLDELTQQLAYLYAPAIRINAIAPGATLPSAGNTNENFNVLSNSIPMGKTGDPQHLRQALRFLIENDYMTGAVIPVDGGWHL